MAKPDPKKQSLSEYIRQTSDPKKKEYVALSIRISPVLHARLEKLTHRLGGISQNELFNKLLEKVCVEEGV